MSDWEVKDLDFKSRLSAMSMIYSLYSKSSTIVIQYKSLLLTCRDSILNRDADSWLVLVKRKTLLRRCHRVEAKLRGMFNAQVFRVLIELSVEKVEVVLRGEGRRDGRYQEGS